MKADYDVIVIGLGHAGCEAALAAARIGARVLGVSMDFRSIARMSCNPSIGGPGKSQLVRELDALGGEMGLAADESHIHIRMLNSGKGPAVRAIRAQMDRIAYAGRMASALRGQKGLELAEGHVDDILLRSGQVEGCRIDGAHVSCKAVVLASGTYLGGRIFVGDGSREGGPEGLSASALTRPLTRAGVRTMRFKTGTSPRIDAGSIRYESMEIQRGEELLYGFSNIRKPLPRAQEDCWITYTNERTHDIIRANLDRAPIFSGLIKGVGPRYCPSIEAKMVRFAEKSRHQLFIEPITRGGDEMYVAGLATSLPEDVQEGMIRTIPGLEGAAITKYGYAIEYDCLDPSQLDHRLESRDLPGFYSAGQANGSSGYEEAAAQGLIAGANAALSVLGRHPLKLDRDQAYIGVLIDDLVMKGTDEPYRMMTARAEYRLSLRQDNADFRLTPKAIESGLADRERIEAFRKKEALKGKLVEDSECRAGIGSKTPQDEWLAACTMENVLLDRAYGGYIEKERRMAAAFRKMEEQEIPPGADYSSMYRLSSEAKEKLAGRRPASLGEASRIPGLSPADLAAMVIHLREGGQLGK